MITSTTKSRLRRISRHSTLYLLMCGTDKEFSRNRCGLVHYRLRLLADLEQLQEANDALEKARKASADHAAMVQRKAEEFQRQQADIDDRMMRLTSTNTSDNAIKKFEGSMDKLNRLEFATHYLDLLQQAGKLRYVDLCYLLPWADGRKHASPHESHLRSSSGCWPSCQTEIPG